MTHVDKARNYSFLPRNQKEHKVLLHRRQRCDNTASECTVSLVPMQSHMVLVDSAVSKRVGIMKECQSQIFEHLGSTLTSLVECFHSCYWRASVKPGLSSVFKIPFKGKPLCGILGNEGFSYTPKACQCCFLLCSRLLWKMQQIWYLLSAGLQHNLLTLSIGEESGIYLSSLYICEW